MKGIMSNSKGISGISHGLKEALQGSEQPKYVYFCGAESTGKTTAVAYVATTYRLAALPETARIELDARRLSFGQLKGDVRAVNEYQKAVFERQVQLEMNCKGSYVADRTCLDSLAYASENARVFRHLYSELNTKYLQLRDRLYSGTVFLMKPQMSINGQDGVRAGAGYTEKQRIDAKIEMLLQLWGISPVCIDTDNGARREELIDAVLEAKGFSKCLQSS